MKGPFSSFPFMAVKTVETISSFIKFELVKQWAGASREGQGDLHDPQVGSLIQAQ